MESVGRPSEIRRGLVGAGSFFPHRCKLPYLVGRQLRCALRTPPWASLRALRERVNKSPLSPLTRRRALQAVVVATGFSPSFDLRADSPAAVDDAGAARPLAYPSILVNYV